MPIQENALNSALASAISSFNMKAIPEETRKGHGTKRCDVQIRRQHNDPYFTAVECKIGQSSNQMKAAVKDAKRWLDQPDCWNSIALCYPSNLSTQTQIDSRVAIENSSGLLMVKVNQVGTATDWHKGNVEDLVKLANDVGANQTYAVTSILRRAVISASEKIGEVTGRELANILELPWKPPENSKIDPRPGRIACLIIANMALLQNRMISSGMRIPGLQKLIAIRKAPNKQVALIENWDRIRDKDYVPVVAPALAVINGLPSDHHTETILATLVDAVLNCATLIHGLQLDHAGQLYHSLLQTARYDGSFYTSTSAAVLLAELAMPPDWPKVDNDWRDPNKITKLRICDPACGTGTLLMASARTIEQRFRSAGGAECDLPLLHLSLVEDVLHGLDINRHAIHLAASMLTLSAPKVDYNNMNLFNMRHGVDSEGKVYAGSLDILVDEAEYILGFAPERVGQRRMTPSGYREAKPNLKNLCDVVIMNPPYTRNSIRNLSLPASERKKVQQHEVELARKTSDYVHREAIHQSTAFTFFAPIADRLLNREGTLAIVQPFTACTAPAATGYRKILTDPTRFKIELIITSHDNRRIFFSENTNIHESLVIARRPTSENLHKSTAFVSLAVNPASASEAYFLAEAIREALNQDDQSLVENYGTITWREPEQIRDYPWNAACFYDQSLADLYDSLLDCSALKPIGNLATVEPAGQGIRGAFRRTKIRQIPDRRALWDHKSAKQTTMRTEPDEFIAAKSNKVNYAEKLWEKRGNLLLANRMYLTLCQTPAVYSNDQILGSAFVPVSPVVREGGGGRTVLSKAWCVWLNSTYGIISFLNIRSRKLSYPSFSLEGLRSLPVPSPSQCDLEKLAITYDQLSDSKLCPFPEIENDPTRHAIDDAVIEAVPGLPTNDINLLRQSIALEPSVHNKKEIFSLN